MNFTDDVLEIMLRDPWYPYNKPITTKATMLVIGLKEARARIKKLETALENVSVCLKTEQSSAMQAIGIALSRLLNKEESKNG